MTLLSSQHPIADPSALTRPTGVMRDGILTDSNRSPYLTPRRRGHNPIYRAPDSVSDVFDWDQLPEYRLVSEGLDREQLPKYRPDPDGSHWGEPPEYRSDPSESSDVVDEERIWVGGPTGGWQAAVNLEVLNAQLDEALAEPEGYDSAYDADVSSGFSEGEDLYWV
ncbi:hypothetical protein N7461_004709 [Penicillium sp. DV-2018c]|nr:hypothetical protein N7461_004709 [Penicillium sp. DV-2018c]